MPVRWMSMGCPNLPKFPYLLLCNREPMASCGCSSPACRSTAAVAACGMRMRCWRQTMDNAIPQFRDSALSQFSIRLDSGPSSRRGRAWLELGKVGRLQRGSATSAPLAALQPLPRSSQPPCCTSLTAQPQQHRTPTRTGCIAASVRAPKVAQGCIGGPGKPAQGSSGP